MKQKLLKNYLLLFLFGMLFVSCELQEEAIKENERNENFKFSQKKFEELMTDKNFKSSFAKLQKSKNTSNSSVISRTIMEDMYGFTIADKPAKVLQTNNFTTYTFLIQRDSLQSTNYFENLVIKTDSLNNTQAVILKYTPFTPLVYLQNHNSSYFNGEVEGQFIIYNNQSSSQSRIVYGCEYSMGLICTGDSDGCGATAHPVTESCVYFTPGCISPTVLGMSCGFYDDSFGGSGGGTSSSDSGSGGGSGGSPNGDTTEDIDLNDGHGGLTTVTVVPEELETNTPCNQLNKLTKNPTYKEANPYMDSQDVRIRTAIINMHDYVNPDGEVGYSFVNTTNNQSYGPYANYTTSSSEVDHVYFKPNAYIFGTIHTHPNDGKHIPMFSHDDIYSLLSIAEYYNTNAFASSNTVGNNLFVCVLTVKIGSSNYTYAIKIDDITKLRALKSLHPNGTGTKTKWDEYGEKLKDRYVADANGNNGSASQYEKAFLDFIQDQDLGISLYEMKQFNRFTPDVVEKWSKIELDNNNPPKRIPCN